MLSVTPSKGAWLGLLYLSWLCVSLSSQEVFDIFHISDLHVDSNYAVNCNSGLAGPAGDFGCDAPPLLVESAIKYMQKVQAQPDLILWTGDNSPHFPNGTGSFAIIYENLKNVTEMFGKYFPGVPVVPVLGNHDTFKKDQVIPV